MSYDTFSYSFLIENCQNLTIYWQIMAFLGFVLAIMSCVFAFTIKDLERLNLINLLSWFIYTFALLIVLMGLRLFL